MFCAEGSVSFSFHLSLSHAGTHTYTHNPICTHLLVQQLCLNYSKAFQLAHQYCNNRCSFTCRAKISQGWNVPSVCYIQDYFVFIINMRYHFTYNLFALLRKIVPLTENNALISHLSSWNWTQRQYNDCKVKRHQTPCVLTLTL